MIQLYKPNAKNTGMALGFQASDREKKLWVTMIKQVSWDAQKAKASFNENKKKPGFSTNLKFSQIEVATMLDALEQNYVYKTVHDAESRMTQITLAPADEKYPGFTFSVYQTDKATNNKSSYFMPLTFGEARLIREYLVHFLHKSFRKIDTSEKEQTASQPEAQQLVEPSEASQTTEFPVTPETSTVDNTW